MVHQEKKLKEITQYQQILTAACMVIASIAIPSSLNAAEIKIGIVNTERVLIESAPAVRAQKKIEKEFLPRDQELKKMTSQIKVLQEQLEREGTSLQEIDRRGKERELANLNREFQRAQRQLREDLSLRQNDEFAVIQVNASKIIQSIAEAEKYDLILQLQDSVYRSQRIDITDKVIKALADK
jgi:outer membrane protein